MGTFRTNRGPLAMFFLFMMLFYPVFGQNGPEVLEMLSAGKIGGTGTANLSCVTTPPDAEVYWMLNGEALVPDDRIQITNTTKQVKLETETRDYRISNLTITNVARNDAGNYTCVSISGINTATKSKVLDLTFPGRFVFGKMRARILKCVFELYYDEPTVEWRQIGSEETDTRIAVRISYTEMQSLYSLKGVGNKHNATYECRVFDSVTSKYVTGTIDVIINDNPSGDRYSITRYDK